MIIKKTSYLFMLLSVIFFTIDVQAQELKKISEVEHENYFQNQLSELFFGNVATTYYNQGVEKQIKDNPVRIITDPTSFNLLENYENKENIEVVIIQFSTNTDLTNTIDLNLLKGFSSLKAIYLSGHFSLCSEKTDDCEKKRISSIILGSTSVEIIYNFQNIN